MDLAIRYHAFVDCCVQVMGGQGVTEDTIVEQVFDETRAFRTHEGPTEVHKWSLAKKIKRDWKKTNDAKAVAVLNLSRFYQAATCRLRP